MYVRTSLLVIAFKSWSSRGDRPTLTTSREAKRYSIPPTSKYWHLRTEPSPRVNPKLLCVDAQWGRYAHPENRRSVVTHLRYRPPVIPRSNSTWMEVLPHRLVAQEPALSWRYLIQKSKPSLLYPNVSPTNFRKARRSRFHVSHYSGITP